MQKKGQNTNNKRLREEKELPKKKKIVEEIVEDSEEEDDYDSSGTESDALDFDETDNSREDISSSEDEEDDGSENNAITVDFEFDDPKEINYKSIRRILERYLPGIDDSFDLSGFADAIVNQKVLGTMVKVDDSGDIYAFATVLPYRKFENETWMKQIKEYILKKAPTDEIKDKIVEALDHPKNIAGLLVSERVLNMPPELAPSVHSSLYEDIEYSKEKAFDKEHYQFNKYLLVSPCWGEKIKEGDVNRLAQEQSENVKLAMNFAYQNQSKQKSLKKQIEQQQKEITVPVSLAGTEAMPPGYLSHYYRFEDALFSNCAETQFAFPVANISTNDISSSSMSLEKPSKKEEKKQKNKKAKKQQDSSDSEEDDNDNSSGNTSLRAPQARRIILFNASEHKKCVDAMQNLLQIVGGGATNIPTLKTE